MIDKRAYWQFDSTHLKGYRGLHHLRAEFSHLLVKNSPGAGDYWRDFSVAKSG